MANNYVSHAYVSIDGQLLFDVVEFSVDTDDTKAPVETMNPNRVAQGYTRGIPKHSWTAKVAIQRFAGEFDWDEFVSSIAGRQIVYERDTDGERMVLVDSVADTISEPYTSDGEVRVDINGKALDKRKI